MNETLMLPPPAPQPPGQALLFSPEIEVEIEKEERQGRYTLERFKKLRPDAYKDCVAILAASKPGYEGLRRIAGIVQVHWITVANVRDEASQTIDTLRDRLSRKMLTAVELLIDRVLESPGSIPAGMLGMHIDQLTKNAELLGNRATARVEKREEIDIYAQWEEIKERLLDPGDVREIGPEIGLEGGNKSAIAAAAASQAGPADRADIDAESTDSDSTAPERCSNDPALPTTDQPNETAAASPDARNGAGGGSPAVAGGGPSRSGSNKQNFSGNAPRRRPLI